MRLGSCRELRSFRRAFRASFGSLVRCGCPGILLLAALVCRTVWSCAPLTSADGLGFRPDGDGPLRCSDDDFYSYANGAWNRETGMPEDREAVGSLPDLRGYSANSRVKDLLEQEHAQAASSGTSRLLSQKCNWG